MTKLVSAFFIAQERIILCSGEPKKRRGCTAVSSVPESGLHYNCSEGSSISPSNFQQNRKWGFHGWLCATIKHHVRFPVHIISLSDPFIQWMIGLHSRVNVLCRGCRDSNVFTPRKDKFHLTNKVFRTKLIKFTFLLHKFQPHTPQVSSFTLK
jgi:hypothetical protein